MSRTEQLRTPGAADAELEKGYEISTGRPDEEALSRFFPSHQIDFCTRVTGDGMAPEYKDGDIVYVRYQEPERSGQDVVCSVDGSVLLRRIYYLPDGSVHLICTNPTCSPITISAESLPSRLMVIGIPVGITRLYD